MTKQKTRPRGRLVGLLAALCASGGTLWAQTSANPSPPPDPSALPAVWKEQKITFHYFGRTARYTCDGIEDKLRALLLEVGVWKNPQLTSGGCVYGHVDLTQQPLVTIKFYALVPASAAAGSVAVLSPHPKPDSKSLAKNPPPNTDSSVIAHYQRFSFKRDSFRNLEEGDCELIEEFARQVLPKLTTRALTTDTRCVPYQVSPGSYHVQGEVLKPLAAMRDAAKTP